MDKATTAKQLNERVIAFSNKLAQMQQDAKALASEIREYAYYGEDKTAGGSNYEEYVYYFKEIAIDLEELSNIDLIGDIEPKRYKD